MTDDPVTEEIARRYLKDLIKQDIDTLILGCTHYPLLKDIIAGIVGEKVTLVNPAYETARGLREMLSENDILSGLKSVSGHEFYVSDSADKFAGFAERLLHIEKPDAGIVDIEES